MKKLSIALAALAACAAPKTAPQPVASSEQTAQTPAPVVDQDGARALIEEGRKIQREQGVQGAAQAIAKYDAAIVKDPENLDALWELGWSHQVLGDFRSNAFVWEALSERNPDYPELQEHLPYAQKRRDQWELLSNYHKTGKLPEVELTPAPGETISIAAVGDVQLGRAWPKERATLPPNNAMDMFTHVKPYLADADITFGNLETALADEGDSTKCGPKSTRCYAFRVPTSYAVALKDAHFDVMSIANNHAGDFGQTGRATTIAALDKNNIHHSGPIGDVAFWREKGLRIGMIAFSTGAGVHAVQDIKTAKLAIAYYAKDTDIMIASFHGGAEGTKAAHVPHGTEMFLGENRGNLRKFTHALIDAGADVVLGHGPHLLRGMEIYKGRLIAYSLGNFTSWDTFNLSGPLGISAVLRVSVAPNGVLTGAKLLPVQLRDEGVPYPDKKARGIELVRKLSREDFGQTLFDKRGVLLPKALKFAPPKKPLAKGSAK